MTFSIAIKDFSIIIKPLKLFKMFSIKFRGLWLCKTILDKFKTLIEAISVLNLFIALSFLAISVLRLSIVIKDFWQF